MKSTLIEIFLQICDESGFIQMIRTNGCYQEVTITTPTFNVISHGILESWSTRYFVAISCALHC